MDRLVWRPEGKIVAVVDGIMVAIDCLVVTALIASATLWGPESVSQLLVMVSSDVVDNSPISLRPTDDVEIFPAGVFTWIALGMGVIFCLVEVIAVWKLLMACKSDGEVITALGNARMWRNIKMVFLIIYIKRLFNVSQSSVNVIDQVVGGKIVGNIMGMVVIQTYIYEMENAVLAQASMTTENDGIDVDSTEND